MSTCTNAIHVHAFLESTSVLIIIYLSGKPLVQFFLRQQLSSVKIHNKPELFNSVAQTAKKGKIPLSRKVGFQRLPVQNRLEISVWFYTLLIKSDAVFVVKFLLSLFY